MLYIANQSECRRCLFDQPCTGDDFHFSWPPALVNVDRFTMVVYTAQYNYSQQWRCYFFGLEFWQSWRVGRQYLTRFFNQCFHPSYYKVRQSPERAKRTVRPPRPPLRRELKAAAPPLPVLRKAQDQDPSLRRRQGKAQGLGPRDQDPDQKEPSLQVCTDILFLVELIDCVSSSS